MTIDTSKHSIIDGGLVRAREGAAILRVSRATFWRYVKLGLLPRGIKLTPRCSVWRVADLDAFVARQAEQREVA
ncbi:AlpA family transcriptional regulator [uncultured Desulfovibrio sp.]|uniref:helix-turn-helix transcriptional regulator n=1 Tax=uncultured Desulfovibrio sp. TaxID=167968 RepID=UPI002630D52C|nr:AlpA family phage regulatory protein [uncultured Desulfovibrio sp.]